MWSIADGSQNSPIIAALVATAVMIKETNVRFA